MDVVELSFTTLHFYEKYLVSNVKENVVLDHPQTQELLDVSEAYYEEKPFVYLSVRKENYNVNPVIYIGLKSTPELLGIGIICERIEKCKMAEFEKKFSSVPFKIFYDMESAIQWVEILHEKRKKAGL